MYSSNVLSEPLRIVKAGTAFRTNMCVCGCLVLRSLVKELARLFLQLLFMLAYDRRNASISRVKL